MLSNKNICFLMFMACMPILAEDGFDVPVEDCVKPRASDKSSDTAIADDCVTTCNLFLMRHHMDRAKKPEQQPQQSWQEWLVNVGQKTVQTYSPVQKAIDLQGFRYPVFQAKAATKTTADSKKLWCIDMSNAIDNHNASTSFQVVHAFKGCLASLSLYQGCHARCKELLNAQCD